MAGNLDPRNPEFTGKNPVNPTIKNRAKFVKKRAVPKSASVSNNTEGDWGRNGKS